MASPGALVGFVADLGAGALRRVSGITVAVEGDSCIIAIERGVIEGLPDLEVEHGEVVTSVSLARVRRADIVDNLVGWKKASQPPTVEIKDLLTSYYRSDTQARAIATDSMLSAGSQPRAPPAIQQRQQLQEGHEADGEEDEEDGQMKMMRLFSQQFQSQWEADTGEVPDLTKLKDLFGQTEPEQRNRSGARSSFDAEVPKAGGPQTGYDRHRSRFKPTEASRGPSGSDRASGVPSAPSMDPQMLMMLRMMKEMKKLGSKEDDERGGKAFKKLHRVRHRCEVNPEAVVSNYVDDVMERLGAEDGDIWQPHQMSAKIS